MRWKFDVVLRHYEIESAGWVVNLADLNDLHIVSDHIISELERTHVDDIYIRIFHSEYPCDFCVLPL